MKVVFTQRQGDPSHREKSLKRRDCNGLGWAGQVQLAALLCVARAFSLYGDTRYFAGAGAVVGCTSGGAAVPQLHDFICSQLQRETVKPRQPDNVTLIRQTSPRAIIAFTCMTEFSCGINRGRLDRAESRRFQSACGESQPRCVLGVFTAFTSCCSVLCSVPGF